MCGRKTLGIEYWNQDWKEIIKNEYLQRYDRSFHAKDMITVIGGGKVSKSSELLEKFRELIPLLTMTRFFTSHER